MTKIRGLENIFPQDISVSALQQGKELKLFREKFMQNNYKWDSPLK